MPSRKWSVLRSVSQFDRKRGKDPFNHNKRVKILLIRLNKFEWKRKSLNKGNCNTNKSVMSH